MTWLKRLGAAAAVVALALVLWLIVGNDVANRRLIAVEKAWAESPGSLDAFPARHPAVPTNETARRLEAAAAAVEIDLRPRQFSRGDEPKRTKGAVETDKSVSGYLEAAFADPSGAAPAPSPEAEAALAKRATALGPVVGILSKETPFWIQETRRGYAAPLPNLLGHLQLQRLLLASALRAASRGDARGAEEFLEASWRLNESLVPRPEVVSQLIAVAVGRMEAGVLRKAPVDPARWVPRLSARDARRGLAEAFTGEAWVFRDAIFRGVRSGPDGEPPSWRFRLAEVLVEPVLRVESATLLETLRRFVLASRTSSVTGLTPESREEPSGGPGRFSQIMAGTMIPNMENARLRGDRLTVDLELTRKVLELRAAKGAGKEWPESVPGIDVAIVKDARWIYARTPDGRATLGLSRRLEWGKTFGLVLPERWISAN